MPIEIEALRRLLAEPTTVGSAELLKEWRKQQALSQTEAAIRLGVSVRTLQGWELGRPMPYPSLLQHAVNINARSADRYTLVQSDFPREFAEFIDFVGATSLDNAIRRVDRKLGALSRSTRSLFGDRYFFHEQCIRFTDSIAPFQLDVTNRVAVRAASLIAGVNRVKRSLSAQAASRLRSMVLDNLMPDRDIRQIEHEFRCSTHFNRKGFQVTFADLEGLGNFDLLVKTQHGAIQVECKTVTEDTGSQIKSELTANLSETFQKLVTENPPVDESGLFILTFRRPTSECKNLVRKLKDALRSDTLTSVLTNDFSMTFYARPEWHEPSSPEELHNLQQRILLDAEVGKYSRCVVRSGKRILGLILRPHKPAALIDRLVAVIKEGADQCPHGASSVVWLHFVGLAEAQFLAAAEFSMEGKGAGLNAVVANALHPSASTTDRTHIQSIRFSADSTDLSQHPALGPNLLVARAVSTGGAIYDVPNPYCRFPNREEADF